LGKDEKKKSEKSKTANQSKGPALVNRKKFVVKHIFWGEKGPKKAESADEEERKNLERVGS